MRERERLQSMQLLSEASALQCHACTLRPAYCTRNVGGKQTALALSHRHAVLSSLEPSGMVLLTFRSAEAVSGPEASAAAAAS